MIGYLRSLVLTTLIAAFVTLVGFGQNTVKLLWLDNINEKITDNQSVSFLNFKDAHYDVDQNMLPRYSKVIQVNSGEQVNNVSLAILEESKVESQNSAFLGVQKVATTPFVEWNNYSLNGKNYCRIEVVPVYKNANSVYKVEEFDMSIEMQKKGSNAHNSNRSSYASNSVLSGGEWYKIAIVKNGIYKIDNSFLKRLGINPKEKSLDNLRIYGNGSGLLPEDNSSPRIDDLVENPIWISVNGKTSINDGDFALFYGEGPTKWSLKGERFFPETNFYEDTNYYFLTFDGGVGSPKRIADAPNLNVEADASYKTYHDFAFHEQELTNLIASGRVWYGENFGVNSKLFKEFRFANISTSHEAFVDYSFAIRSVNSVSEFTASANGFNTRTTKGGNVGTWYLDTFAKHYSETISGKPVSHKIGVNFDFQKANGEASAWLDKIVINCTRKLVYANQPMSFRNIAQLNLSGVANFQIENVNSLVRIWDITDPTNTVNQLYSIKGRVVNFQRAGGNLNHFIAFTNSQAELPANGYKISNQNLHSLAAKHPDMIIYSPSQMINYAEQVADFHREKDGFIVEVIDVEKVYNEFSSGKQDLSALRDFMRMLYKTAGGDKNKEPRYLLLFGDASYDFKDRISGNTNLIPIYQFENSLNPIQSIATDDFLSFLGDGYNGDVIKGVPHLGVGRLPVKNERQAAQAVSKIINYDRKESLGKWRLGCLYVGDDEDNGLHMRQASGLADTVNFLTPTYNVQKTLSDAYPQISTPGGNRYPDVNRIIDEQVERGALTVNYVGHGGELGWASERILEVPQINKWNNPNNMPLFVTATCEFSRFDDPKRTSAGEFVFLNPDGGAVGLLTTTRVVYASPNYDLAQAFNQIAYSELNGEMPRLGDIVVQTKLRPQNFNANSRAFALLGDPALRLNYPEHKIETITRPDTIGALQKVTISGMIKETKSGAKLNSFNGTVHVTVFDKRKNLETLANDGGAPTKYQARINTIFRGKATVTNGDFNITFVVPKDVDLSKGNGKISYYAENGVTDAAGFDTTVVVGGQVGDPLADQTGPDVRLFMNDTTFVRGGMTDENPMLFAQLYDNNGINTSGSGVGHDIVAILDENTSDELVLNEYYESVLNSYQRGVVRYNLKDLPEGKHTLSLKAWDVYNNSGSDKTEFIVSGSAELALAHVLNYPNPFTTKTDFFFEHNYPNADLSVRIQIFTVSGKIVKTIDGFYNSQGYRVGPISWDGKDDFGDKIGKGVYVYNVEVKAPNGDVTDKFEKLVILN